MSIFFIFNNYSRHDRLKLTVTSSQLFMIWFISVLACEKCIIVIYAELQLSSYNVLTSQLTSLEAGHYLMTWNLLQLAKQFKCSSVKRSLFKAIFLQTRDVYKMVVAFNSYFWACNKRSNSNKGAKSRTEEGAKGDRSNKLPSFPTHFALLPIFLP